MTEKTCTAKATTKGAWGGNGFGSRPTRTVCGQPLAEGSTRLCPKHLAAEEEKRAGAIRAAHSAAIAAGIPCDLPCCQATGR